MFCPKTTKFGPKLAFLVNLGQAMQACSVPCWLVGWWLWRAGCISQDTYLLYLFFTHRKDRGFFDIQHLSAQKFEKKCCCCIVFVEALRQINVLCIVHIVYC